MEIESPEKEINFENYNIKDLYTQLSKQQKLKNSLSSQLVEKFEVESTGKKSKYLYLIW